MFYSLVHFPQIDTSRMAAFRQKYDPYVGLVDPHITLVFPVPDSFGKDLLIQHIEKQLSGWKPFEIRVKGLEKAWDHWLFLVLEKGNSEVIRLHDDLYQGALRKELRTDIEFIPHIAIGLFVKSKYDLRDPKAVEFDEAGYSAALPEAIELDTGQESIVNKLHLVEIDDQFKKSTVIKEFLL
jgi:2'-5' RNA ligase